MTVLRTSIDTRSLEFRANVEAMREHLEALDDLLARALAGGGEKYVTRHRKRGKLLARERIELLLDRDAPFLELSPVAGANTEYNIGAGVVSGIGVIEGVECVIVASDPTDKGGAINPIGLAKGLRALEIAAQNRLPVLYLVESAGGDLPRQIDVFLPGGKTFRELTRLSAEGIPTIAIVFGSSTAGGAYLPGMSDYTVFVEGEAKVFLGGPPLVKMATGEESSDEELGGAQMHASTSGLADFMAADESDAIRLGRMLVSRLNWTKRGGESSHPAADPLYDLEELLGVASADLKVPFDVTEVIARIVDRSEFDEFKPLYGKNLVTGWARIHGYEIGILANHRGVLFSEESQKAAQFIQLANRTDTPLLFVQNVTGFMVGASYEQGGIIKHGSMMINAVSNSTVPHLTLQVGGSYGAGNYAMAGRPYDPRFLFVWPNAKTCIMGAEQLAGTLSIVARAAAERSGTEFDDEADAQRRTMIKMKIEQEEQAAYLSGRVLDDGIIDPRDTRTVLGIALSVVHSAEVSGTDRFGIFRM
ncbi:MAG: carboxyl transferase domain-containing protein [Acidimicrobiia bacterium]|nr:MAG: carboxyl transferase domain-containing protein [Acidimicrobiia bacterium]